MVEKVNRIMLLAGLLIKRLHQCRLGDDQLDTFQALLIDVGRILPYSALSSFSKKIYREQYHLRMLSVLPDYLTF
jgi:hypothetical protein